MKAEVNPLGELILTIGYNFSISFGTDQIMLDEEAAKQLVQGMVGKPFRNIDKTEVGKVIDYMHVPGTCHFYVYVKIHDRHKDLLLMQLQAQKLNIESKVNKDGKAS